MKVTTLKIKKIITSIAIGAVLLYPHPLLATLTVVTAHAQVAPTPPPAPTAPTAPTTEEAISPSPSPSSSPESSNTQEPTTNTSYTTSSPSPSPASPTSQETTTSPTSTTSTASGQTGDTVLKTGDAVNSVSTVTVANTNLDLTLNPSNNTSPTAQDTTIDANGSNSNNAIDLSNTTNQNTNQTNIGSVANNLDQNTITGDNTANFNLGNTTVISGDANTSGTLLTTLNTNLAGVAVAEFNVVEDHQGDIILDFSSSCILGCDSLLGSITNNGSDSTNSANINQSDTKTTFQVNDGETTNNMTLASDSGNNTASFNTGGDNTIVTGDANVSANAITFLNNNISGNVAVGVVNIYGDLNGDIILPSSVFDSLTGSSNSSSTISENGSGSQNATDINQTTNTNTNQANTADIENNLIFAASTGDNDANLNTGGNTTVKTGDANVETQTLNIANNNVEGGDWWLVLVNVAGEWIGQLFGGNGGNMAGSSGTQFQVGQDGSITATNGNGTDSQNTQSVNEESNTDTTQTNNAKVTNNLNLQANTGGNKTNFNTGGDNTIITGDANIVANLINFVNNNITGGGKLLVTIVNVFGEWTGNFLPPGFTKEDNDGTNNNEQTENTGGTAVNPEQNSNPSISDKSSNNNNNSSNTINKQNTTNNSSNGVSSNGTKKFHFLPQTTGSTGLTQTVLNQAEGDIEGAMSLLLPNSSQEKVAKTLHLNLAWLITILPFAGLSLIRRLLTRFVA